MERSWRCVLISVLWLAWLALLPGTFVAILVTGDSDWSRFWWMSSAALAAVAWINWLWHRRDRLGPACGLIASGMTLGMLADVYGAFEGLRFTEPLMMIVPLFAAGHVGYIMGFTTLARRLQLTSRPKWRGRLARAVVLFNVIGAGLWATLVQPSSDLPNMHVPTAVYTVFLSGSTAVMATVARFDKRLLAAGVGGVLFLVSDGFLAVRLFQDNWRGLGDLCWITYGIGQMLIVYGVVAGTWRRPTR